MSGVGPFTNLDLAVIAIVVLSGLVAMYRGLTREVLSILSWAAAAGAVFYFIRYHKDIAEEVAKQFANPVQTSYVYVAQVAIGGLIFLDDGPAIGRNRWRAFPIRCSTAAWVPLIASLAWPSAWCAALS